MIYRGHVRKVANKALNEIPDDLRTLFASLKDESGESFVHKAYSGIVKYMGLEDFAPEKVILNFKEDGLMSVTGGFNTNDNTISFSKGFVSKLTKEQQFSMLSHELKHCEQFNNMLRTENIGVSGYVNAYVDNMLKKFTSSSASDSIVDIINRRDFEDAVKEGGNKEEILNIIRTQLTDQCIEQIKEKFAKTLSLPKIKVDSAEGKKAQEYIEAFREYKGLGFLGISSEEYLNNLLEKEAYAFGDKMEEYFKKFFMFSNKK